MRSDAVSQPHCLLLWGCDNQESEGYRNVGNRLIDYWDIYNKQVDSFEQCGDLEEAAHLARELIRHYPGFAPAWKKRADLLLRVGRDEEAEEAYKRAWTLDPDDRNTAYALAKQLTLHGHTGRAKEVLRRPLERGPEWPEGRALYCELLTAEGDLTGARREAESAIAASPASCPLSLVLLRALALAGAPEAGAQLARCREQAGTDAGRIEELAHLLLELNRAGEAAELCAAFSRTAPLSPEAACLFARALDACGENDKALQLMERVGQKAPSAAVRRELRTHRLRQLGSARKSRTVLFVSQHPRGREAKLAHAARLGGWQPLLLYHQPPTYDPLAFFDEALVFQHPDQALALADRISPALLHVCSLHADPTCAAFIREKSACTLFDTVDLYDTLCFDSLELHEAQRFCLTNADGLVCRDLRARHARLRGGYRLPKKLLYFPEYCWGGSHQPMPERSGEIHVVQAGWIDIERMGGVKEASILEFVSALARNGVHVHLFQHLFLRNLSINEVYQDFLQLAQETGCVHVHPNVPPTELVRELEQYHIGLLVASDQRTLNRRVQFAKGMEGAGAARLTDYLDAGLAALVSPDQRFIAYTARRYGVCALFTREMLHNPRAALAPLCTPEVRAEVHRRSESYSLARHAPRLVRFYQSCVDSQSTRE